MGNLWFRDRWADGADIPKSGVRDGFRDFVPAVMTVSEVQATTTASQRTVVVAGVCYQLDAADTTSAHNGTSVLVSADGQRYKRVDQGESSGAAALALLDGEEGIAFDFKARSAAIVDYTGAKSRLGRPEQLLTVTRGSTATYCGRDRRLKTAAINELRYHHDPATGEPLGVLREASGPNLLPASEDAGNGTYFTLTNVTVTANATAAPDGATTADKLVENTDTSQTHSQHRNAAGRADITANTAHCYSRWFQAGERTKFRMQLVDPTFVNQCKADFDLIAKTAALGTAVGAAVNIACGIEEWVDGWFRCWIAGTIDTTSVEAVASTVLRDAAGATTYNGVSTYGLYVWGEMIEPGVAPSSYMPTTTAAVTRASELVSIATSAFPVSLADLTMWGRARPHNTTPSQRVAVLNATGTATDSVYVGVSNGPLVSAVWSGSVQQASVVGGTPVAHTEFTFGVAARKNDVAVDSSLFALTTDSAANMPTALSTLYIGCENAGTVAFYGTIADLVVITRRLTNAELTAKTG